MRFLLVDDHPLIREGLERTLGAEFPGSVFATAATQAEALAAVEADGWEVVLLDLSLPGRDGLSFIRDIKDRSPHTRVLVHTMHPEDQMGVRALRAGADGYITKDRPEAELLAAVRKVKAGQRYVSESLGERLADFVMRGENVELADTLSDREYQILRMITLSKTPTEIADELHLSVKTISTYRSRILEKLGLQTTSDLIRFGLEHKLG